MGQKSKSEGLPSKGKVEEKEEIPITIAILCYLSYAIVILFGHLRDFLRYMGWEKTKQAVEFNRPGYVPLFQSWPSFYNRNIFRRIKDGWSHPIASVPGAEIDTVDIVSDDYNWTFRFPGTYTKAANMGSYNYLGYAQNQGAITDTVKESIKQHGFNISSTRHEVGTLRMHRELEGLMAKFLGTDDCVIVGMGFGTNSTNIPTLCGKGCLIISDELNHASIILGCRLSGSQIRVFNHNDMKDLEKKLRDAIALGQPRSHRPWKKIIIVLEGVYSMEGSVCQLDEVIRLKKKYKCYVYLDEAHSIGAVGKNGRGLIDYYNIDPNDVDVLMGTFTKSFGAAGGYIAGKQDLIDHIRINSHSFAYATSMAPPVCQQITSVLKSIMGLDGTNDGRQRIEQLARNTRYFRERLKQLGFIVHGHNDSPVVPVMIYFPGKIVAFIRLALRRGVAIVGAGFPATPLIEARVRFCLSAAHTKEMLDRVLEVVSEVGDILAVKYSSRPRSTACIEY